MSNIIDKIQVSGVTYDLVGGGGGGKTIEAGRGISVTTGETADTVSFNLPISAGTGTNSLIIGESTNISNSTRAIAIGYKTKAQQSNAFAQGHQTDAGQEQSHAEGYQTKAYGANSHSEGRGTSAMTSGSHAEGFKTITSNSYEHTQGQYNVSNKASTTFGDSGNTLFSVGNGTANDARHNAFEIRQNGDIYITSGGTDIKLQDNLGGGGGNPTVELTQAEYDALVTAGTVQADTYYIITDAQGGDLSNYMTSAQTMSAITEATSGLQVTLTAGTGIDITDNVISATGGGGGGKTIEAGRGISVTTGETADTVSFDLPISAGTGTGSIVANGNATKATGNQSFAEGYSTSATSQGAHSEGMYSKATNTAAHAEGQNTTASGIYSHAEGKYAVAVGASSHAEGENTAAGGDYSFAGGRYSSANTSYSFAHGRYINANNESEHSIGKFNVSNTGSTDADKTLFSVGNGTSASARHNAFEIRQNGDVYLNDGTNDVKLQDYLQIKVVKLTQSAYDALSPDYDSNTLYVIVN